MRHKPTRLFRTKHEVAALYAAGTWFVFPTTQQKRFTYYRPKVYRVLPDGKVGDFVYEDFGVWELTGSADDAFARAQGIADTLNAIGADDAAAMAYVEKRRRERQAAAMNKVAKMLLGDDS